MSDDSSHGRPPSRRPKLHSRPFENRAERSFGRDDRVADAGEPARSRGPRLGFRYRVDLEYMGTRYSGWQFQTNARTVAGEIMEAIHRATGQRVIEVYGSGRTDAGVHALHQVAHVDLAKAVDAEEFLRAVNDELPGDINLLKVELAGDGFHARHSATARTYLYRISRRRSAFDKPVVWWVRDPLDVKAMAQAAASLCGLHDFAAFAQADPSKPDESTKVKVEAVEVFEEGPNLFIRIRGSHFLWKMVRRVVGVLVEVGRGKLSPSDVARIMSANGASVAEFTAPPSGLSLEKVTYGVPAATEDGHHRRSESFRPEPARPKETFRRGPIVGTYRPKRHAGDEGERADPPNAAAREPGFEGWKRKAGFRPQVERKPAAEGHREGGWPRRSASPGSPPAPGKRTFRRRG